MEVIILLIIFWAISSSSSKKKKAKQAGRQASKPATRPERSTVTSSAMPKDEFAPKGAFAPKAGQPAKPASRQTLIEQEKGARCESKPMHLHDVTQAQMHAAGEGEDPCHKGGDGPVTRRKTAARTTSASEDSPVYASPIYDDEDERRERLREDFVRGIVMSEILMTPKQRQALRRAEAESGRI